MTKSLFRFFNVTFGARRGTGHDPFLFFLFVAFEAQFVHHLLLFKLALRFQLLNYTGFLRVKRMANIAIIEFVLVAVMRKGNRPCFSAGQFDFCCTLISSGSGT